MAMQTRQHPHPRGCLLLLVAGCFLAPCRTQGQDLAGPEASAQASQDVVITGTATSTQAFRSGLSIGTLDREDIQSRGAANAADLLRSVPGFYAQSSGGEGNANITARGLPISGGAKFVLMQEDGLPVLAFGDIDFATADTFLRTDYGLDRVEYLRGGTAATLASNSPGGIVDFVSLTGENAAGRIGLTRGLGFDRTRVDFTYGAPVDDRWRYQVSGFWRQGEGERTFGYRAEDGHQLRANFTRVLPRGYVRLHLKLLDDRAPVLLPVPVSITGTAASPGVSSLPGFDVGHGALQTPAWRQDLSVNRDGSIVRTDLRDGYRSLVQSIGLESSLELAPRWRFEGRARLAATSGRFVGPYPAQVVSAAALAEQVGGPGATLRYATGDRAGQAILDPASLAGNGLAVRTLLFDTTLDDMTHSVADLRLAHAGEAAGGDWDAVAGLYASRQAIDQDWHWNTYLQEVRGDGSDLLDVVAADGTVLTQRGLVDYGEPFWGNCCVRSYRLRYGVLAPYLQLHWRREGLDLDASVRQDLARASGSYAGAGPVRALDVDGDGVLQPPETRVPVVDPAASLPVSYALHYTSFSVGAGLLLSPGTALFARASRGGRANAERLLFGGGITPDGKVPWRIGVDLVQQHEAGLRLRSGRSQLTLTAFHSRTQVSDQDITSTVNRFVSRVYRADGLEADGRWERGGFALAAGLTWTRSRVVSDGITPQDVGRQVNPRTLAFVAPSWRGPFVRIGAEIITTSRSPALPEGITAPSFTQVNVVASVAPHPGWWLSLQVLNVFDRIGITEIPSASAGITPDGVNTARSITGRTAQLTLTHDF